MRGCRLLSVVVMLVTAGFCLGIWSMGWASPGSKKWDYSAVGGEWYYDHVVIDELGNRIIGSTAKSGSEYYWIIVSLNKNGGINWQKTHHSPHDAYLIDIKLDSKNNVIAAGIQDNNTDFFWHVASYKAADGALNWETDINKGAVDKIGMSGVALLHDMVIDGNDNIVLTGLTLDSSNDLYGYICSMSATDHSMTWQNNFGAANQVWGWKLAVDSENNIILAAWNNDSWKVISYTPSGGTNWQKEFNSGKTDLPYAIAVDSKDNVIVGGIAEDDKWKVICYSSSGNQLWEDLLLDGRVQAITTDSKDNIIVAGYSGSGDWRVISYTPSGGINWQKEFDGGYGTDIANTVAVDANDNVIVTGYVFDGSHNNWYTICCDTNGLELWHASYDSGDNDEARNIAIDKDTGEVVVVGYTGSGNNVRVIDYEGYPPPAPPAPAGHVLAPSEVRTVQPAAETPNGNPVNGTYLGFGDVVASGTHFKVEAAFPAYLKQSDNSTLAVKIFIAAQMPDDYSRLAYFDSSNNMKFQPPDKLSSWKSSVSGEVAKTTIYPEVDVTSALSNIPSGTHYWYTLVVPATVPDDFSGVDWSTTPWEITVNIFDVR